MKAIYVQSEPGQIVHNKSLEDDCGKFQINETVHENIQYWQEFDADVHCPDTYIKKTDHVLRRHEYSLEKIIPDGILINYKLHYIKCTECSSGCEMFNDKVYMQCRELIGTLAPETLKKPKKTKVKSDERNINKKIKTGGEIIQIKERQKCLLYHLHSSCPARAKIIDLKNCMHNTGECNLMISAGNL